VTPCPTLGVPLICGGRRSPLVDPCMVFIFYLGSAISLNHRTAREHRCSQTIASARRKWRTTSVNLPARNSPARPARFSNPERAPLGTSILGLRHRPFAPVLRRRLLGSAAHAAALNPACCMRRSPLMPDLLLRFSLADHHLEYVACAEVPDSPY
jgi:hypothetical protein